MVSSSCAAQICEGARAPTLADGFTGSVVGLARHIPSAGSIRGRRGERGADRPTAYGGGSPGGMNFVAPRGAISAAVNAQHGSEKLISRRNQPWGRPAPPGAGSARHAPKATQKRPKHLLFHLPWRPVKLTVHGARTVRRGLVLRCEPCPWLSRLGRGSPVRPRDRRKTCKSRLQSRHFAPAENYIFRRSRRPCRAVGGLGAASIDLSNAHLVSHARSRGRPWWARGELYWVQPKRGVRPSLPRRGPP